MKIFKKRYAVFLAVMMILLGTQVVFPTAMADGADAELHNVELLASPSSQGLGGVIIIDAAAYFYGGCCYHLYANDVTANLTAPEDIVVLSGPTPEKYDEVDAEPGGKATIVHFKWTVSGSLKGAYNLTTTISSKNCGSVENSIGIEIVEGCIISAPEIYPKEPQVRKDNIIQVTASTSLEGRSVSDVTFFYVTGKKFRSGEPVNGTLSLDDGSTVRGAAVILNQDELIPEKWTCTMKPQSTRTLYYWFVATDDLGENTTSSLAVMEITDPDRIDSITGSIFWGSMIIALIGFILIFEVQSIYFKRKDEKSNVLKLEDQEQGKEITKHKLDLATLSILAFSIVVLVLAAVLGWIGEIVDLALG